MKVIRLLAIIIFLTACASAPVQPTSTITPSPVPTETHTPTPTLTAWEQSAPEEIASIKEEGVSIVGLNADGELRYLWDASQVEWLALPKDLPAGAHLSEDGLTLLDADGKDLYVLEKNDEGKSSWVEAMMPLENLSPEMRELWKDAEVTLADEIASGEVEIRRGTETDWWGEWEYVKKVSNDLTEEKIRSVPSYVDRSNDGNGDLGMLEVGGVLSGDWEVRKLIKRNQGDISEGDIVLGSSMGFVNSNDKSYDEGKRDGGVRKVKFAVYYYLKGKMVELDRYENDSKVKRLREGSPELPRAEDLDEFFKSGCLNDGKDDTVDLLIVSGAGLRVANVDVFALSQDDLDNVDLLKSGLRTLDKSHDVE